MRKIFVIASIIIIQLLSSVLVANASVPRAGFLKRVATTTMATYVGEVLEIKVGAPFLSLPAIGMALALNDNRTQAHEQAMAALITCFSRNTVTHMLYSTLEGSKVFDPSINFLGGIFLVRFVHALANAIVAESVFPPIVNLMNSVITQVKKPENTIDQSS